MERSLFTRLKTFLSRPAPAGLQPIARADQLKAGALYSIDNKDGTFSVAKVLVLEPGIVHARTYKQKFPARPRSVNVAELSLGSVHDGGGFGMGHLPLRDQGFLAWLPVFVMQTSVAQDELHGYEIWKEAGGGVW